MVNLLHLMGILLEWIVEFQLGDLVPTFHRRYIQIRDQIHYINHLSRCNQFGRLLISQTVRCTLNGLCLDVNPLTGARFETMNIRNRTRLPMTGRSAPSGVFEEPVAQSSQRNSHNRMQHLLSPHAIPRCPQHNTVGLSGRAKVGSQASMRWWLNRNASVIRGLMEALLSVVLTYLGYSKHLFIIY